MNEHVRGNPNAAVVLVEYADFECPYCGMAYPYVKRIGDRYGDEVAEVFRPFPLEEIHPHALHAAQAAEAAGLQGKFWEMHDTLFENQKRLSDTALLQYAADIGLDLNTFKHDFASPQVIEAIETGMRRGAEDGVRGTPAFILNGRQLDLENYQDLETIVAKAVRERV
jgi:protein-disulfide isomerase